MAETFRALCATEAEGKCTVAFKDLTVADLPEGEVLVKVAYSTLNYKDGLALSGNRGKVMRKLPMVPGIDCAGTVIESRSPAFKAGEAVVVTGWGLSETHWGGYSQRASLPAAWLVKLPPAIDARRAMAIGTAGFTAMLAVMALEDAGLRPGDRPVLVTGAAGGVGSVAVALLSRLGHRVAAATGRPATHDYLKDLGANEIVERSDLAKVGRPLESERWAGAVDTVGSQTLAMVLAQTTRHGSVAACGLAGGSDLPTTVLPFILRGVNLLGIDSVYCPPARRQAAWHRLAKDLPLDKLDAMTTVVPLAEVLTLAPQILQGQIRGRTVVDVNA
ncbi:MAG: oxidoreductase [Alphaproteobacteria bacterium]|nr:oxidoreductase [Alphaproteobacteria bacterium]